MLNRLTGHLAIIGYPIAGLVVLVWVGSGLSVVGLPIGTTIGLALLALAWWATTVALAQDARWTAGGFAVITATFGLQTLSQSGVQSRLVLSLLIGTAVLLLLIGNRPSPAEPA